MRVDDPFETIRTFCSFGEAAISYEAFKREYEAQNNNGRPISKSHAQAHFFMFSVLGLAQQVKETVYRRTDKGKILCSALGDDLQFQRALGEVLTKNQEKGDYIASFLAYLNKSRSETEVMKKYHRAGRTLIAWCSLAGLIRKKGKSYSTVLEPIEGVESFWSGLKNAYNIELRTESKGLKKQFARIDDLRRYLVPRLPSMEAFDNYVRTLMADPRYSRRIELSGATVAYAARERLTPLEYKRKYYYFLTLIPN